jgi:glutamine synthetase
MQLPAEVRTMANDKLPQEARDMLKQYPDSRVLEILLPDINGILRGKRVSRDEFDKALAVGVNLPGATVLLDSQGRTFDCLDYGSSDGDPDVICRAVAGSLVPVPWAYVPSLQVLTGMYNVDGSPYFADSRHVLQTVLDKHTQAGHTPVVAIELEFYLLQDAEAPVPQPRRGKIPGTEMLQRGPQYASLDDLYELDEFLEAVQAACRLQGVPASAAVAEFSPGQFEINLHHVNDPLLACDHAMMLRRIVKNVARKAGMSATFMAKPFADHAGSGMHIHASVVDREGQNIFAAGTELGARSRVGDNLRHAVGGLASTMGEAMALFAPNANSYRRLKPESLVPVTPNWGVNHRNLSLRVPLSDPENARVEHRVAGADANPYLVMAAVLAGMHHGMVNHMDPGPMIEQGTRLDETVTLPIRWETALDAFARSGMLPAYLGEEFCRVFEAARREESETYHSQVSAKDYQWYLRAL